jgi:hypothetical protein
MRAEAVLRQFFRACGVCRLQRAEEALDEMELMLTYYIELNPTPEVYGELLARYLGAEAPDPDGIVVGTGYRHELA